MLNKLWKMFVNWMKSSKSSNDIEEADDYEAKADEIIVYEIKKDTTKEVVEDTTKEVVNGLELMEEPYLNDK